MPILFCPRCGCRKLTDTDDGWIRCVVCSWDFLVKEREQEGVRIIPDPYVEYLRTDV